MLLAVSAALVLSKPASKCMTKAGTDKSKCASVDGDCPPFSQRCDRRDRPSHKLWDSIRHIDTLAGCLESRVQLDLANTFLSPGHRECLISTLRPSWRLAGSRLLPIPAISEAGCVEFDTNQFDIAERHQEALDEIAAKASGSQGPLVVMGSADSCGKPANNLNLSELRAESVAKDLRGNQEVGYSRPIYTLGLGESFWGMRCDCASQLERTACVYVLQPYTRLEDCPTLTDFPRDSSSTCYQEVD